MTNNFADAECRSDWLANRPDAETPALADVADPFGSPYIPAWPKWCAGSWDAQHDTPEQVADCPACVPGWDEPPC